MAKEETHSRSHAGMGGKKSSSKKSGKKPIHETHIRHYKSGGHEVTHHFKEDDGTVTPGDPAMMADKAALMAHLQSTVPDNGSAQAAPPSPDMSQAAPPSAGPAPAAAGPQPGM